MRLAEASDHLGGTAVVAAAAPGRQIFTALIAWLAGECRRLGVEIELGHRVTAEEAGAHPGPVVVAIGGRDGSPAYEIAASGLVLSARAFLAGVVAGRDTAEGPVLVWDPVGGPIGVSIAELLAQRGPTTLACPDQIAGQRLALTGDLVAANIRLQSGGVRLVRRCVLRRVGDGSAEVEDLFGGGMRAIPATLVIDAGPRLPAASNDVETHALTEGTTGTPVAIDVSAAGDTLAATDTLIAQATVIAGDAVAPRTIYEAVLEGRRAVLGLGRAERACVVGAAR